MKLFFTLLITCFTCCLFAQDSDEKPQKKIALTQQIQGQSPTIDAKLDDPAWETVAWNADFIQQQPYPNEAPSQETAFKILYDSKNLYIAFRCSDTEPDSIVRRLSRRDGFEGDWVEINIDSYHDLRTAFSFTISASGVKGDEFISNNGNNWDASWDPIWYTKTAVVEDGWVAEVKIPLSQLRFSKEKDQVWGIQLTRRLFRKEERSIWQYIPPNSGTWVSDFGELHGLVDLQPQKQLEIQPYVVAKAETFEREVNNPFATGRDFGLTGGLDGKIGITNDMTLDFTINPDFGQVEADPSVLALDGFQVFFNERRPFFIENRNIFSFNVGGNSNLFYSRRIGRSPNYYPNLKDNEYSDQPDNTAILGATKFSGKLKNGLSIGVLESVTAKTFAQIDNDGDRRKEEVEPLTNYFVSRLQKDFDGGNRIIGGIFTSTNRFFEEDSPLSFLHKSAYSGGLDFTQFWKERMWSIEASTIFSNVKGTKESILETQQSHERYFQRPDANHVSIDENRESLSGHGGRVRFGKNAGKLLFSTSAVWYSPGLELNDLGFMRRADQYTQYLNATYRINDPFSVFRSINFNYNQWSSWDFGGSFLNQGFNVNTNMNFKNNYSAGTGVNYEPFVRSNTALRGGPSMLVNQGLNNWLWVDSDERKKFRYNIFMAQWRALNNDGYFRTIELGATFQPLRTLNIRLAPNYSRSKNNLQYVTNLEYENQDRYINAEINQETFSMSVRLNYTILPNLTIQYYGQPFITIGKYSNFKYITAPNAKEFEDRYITLKNDQISYDENFDEYAVDENLDRAIDYYIGNPDFNFIQFRSNLVARWEYIPGSELFLVWSQGNTQSGSINEGLLEGLNNNLLGTKANNIFLVKMTYRFLL